MPQINNHLKWCLKDSRRLVKAKPDLELAQKHLKKSEYNYGVLQTLEKLKWIAKHRRAVNLIIGLFFLAFGILLLSGEYLSFVSLLYRLIPWRVGVM